VLKSHIFCSTA